MVDQEPCAQLYIPGNHASYSTAKTDDREMGWQGHEQSEHLPTGTLSAGQAKDRKKGGVYEAPTYRVKRRTGLNFITTFQLRTEDDKSKWTLRGVALLGSID